MMTPLLTSEMDISNRTPIFVFLMIHINCVSGLVVPEPVPENLKVDILDGMATAHWDHPVGAPANSQYNVQMAKRPGKKWDMVASCTGITTTKCDLNSLIDDYKTGYKVKVQLVTGKNVSSWIKKSFQLSESKLSPPVFTLSSTSSNLTVRVQQNPTLAKMFPFRFIYTVSRVQIGQDNKTTIAIMKEEDQGIMTFSSLHPGTEHCVSMKVQNEAMVFPSNTSSEQCVRLSQQEWYIDAVTSLSILGVLAVAAIMATILLCYLRRPEKTPAVLKTPMSGWLPLFVGEGTLEVVTDKGWFLSSARTEVKKCVKIPVTHNTITKNNQDEDRKTSMDSGVSMESNSSENSRERSQINQEDSGCGSLGGPESSTSNQTNYPVQEERTHTDTAWKTGDSRMGLDCQLHSSSMNLDGEDSRLLLEDFAGGNYRSQCPSAMQVHVGDEEAFEQMLCDSVLAKVVTGYRAEPQSCICSGAGQCTWCHKQGHYRTGVIKQHRAVFFDNGLQTDKCNTVNSFEGITFPSYSNKTQMDTVMMDDLEKTFLQLGETFPMLTALTPLPLVEGGQDFNTNNISLSLCDVQLTTN